MASAIEVVGDVDCVTVPEFALHAKICLLRVRVNEILGLRISEGLECNRQWGVGQIVLIEEGRLRKIQGLELLLIGQISQRGVDRTECRGRALREGGIDQRSLENRNGVQVTRLARACAARGSSECQLAAGRTVRGVAEKIQSQQRVVIKQSIRRADDSPAVAF